MFLPRVLIVLNHIFKVFNPFWVNFYCGVKVQFNFFACWYPVFLKPFAEKTALSPLCSLGTLIKNHSATYMQTFITGLSIQLTALHLCLYARTTPSQSLLLCCTFWNQGVGGLQFCSSLLRLFWLFIVSSYSTQVLGFLKNLSSKRCH